MWVKFYLEQNEDCHPGDGTSDGSERLLQRGGVQGKVSLCDSGEGKVHAVKHLSHKMFSASGEELMSPWRDLVLLLDMKRCKHWAHKINSWK